MDFKLIKKVLFMKGPVVSFPEREKRAALMIVFLALVFLFGGMFIFLSLFIDHRIFFFGKTNLFEDCLVVGSFLYIIVQFYDLIVRYAGSQEAIDDLKRDNQQNKKSLTVQAFFTTVLPIFAVYLLNQWLKAKDYFGWFK